MVRFVVKRGKERWENSGKKGIFCRFSQIIEIYERGKGQQEGGNEGSGGGGGISIVTEKRDRYKEKRKKWKREAGQEHSDEESWKGGVT